MLPEELQELNDRIYTGGDRFPTQEELENIKRDHNHEVICASVRLAHFSRETLDTKALTLRSIGHLSRDVEMESAGPAIMAEMKEQHWSVFQTQMQSWGMKTQPYPVFFLEFLCDIGYRLSKDEYIYAECILEDVSKRNVVELACLFRLLLQAEPLAACSIVARKKKYIEAVLKDHADKTKFILLLNECFIKYEQPCLLLISRQWWALVEVHLRLGS